MVEEIKSFVSDMKKACEKYQTNWILSG
jgi:hypothetical protein